MLGEAIFIFATNIYNVFSSHIVVSEGVSCAVW
jgi:hypothetical protein